MRSKIVCLLLLSVILGGCVSSGGTLTVAPACSSGAVSPQFETYWLNWQGLSFLAASTVFLIAAFVYALGHVLVHRKVIMWAREQMEEALLAMAITVFIIGFVSFLCTFDMQSLGIQSNCAPNCNLVNVGFGYLNDFFTEIMEGFFVVAGLNAVMTSQASMTIGKATHGVGVTVAPLAVFNEISASLTMAMVTLMTSAIFVITQMVLLKMTESIFVILFPIGVLLRSFGATRGFGGGLIAIAIGFFVFYPLLVVLFYGATLGDIQTTYGELSGAFKEGGLSPATSDWFNPIGIPFVGFVGKVIVGAILMPLVMFMILVSFVKGLSYILGEEVDVSNLTRLI